ncbi:MAG TPA: NAD-dependent epimerase/dehydratase family protein [Saprospiraceae bacterium]|nr:NAD(P)H-binding protein [Saprospiraceae bacterium]HPG08004.1 NAD-dependent epimerase/dehydratase family protein [Saprospiraceae bacterium]HPR00919.1 NAD-dependent epimerase/dehydratase family protein [Saprospiraceae bacterium]HQU55075.1 NAD-dependent epimerase/dehydratase family protein [Saprospiraceae bacterium]HRV84741.1 NAD-dependent epimerase/dehydratase family protein [Saprospiraceae bacterium]
MKDPLDIHAGNKIALVAGATGLIGNEVVRQLLNHPAYSKVKVFVRRHLSFQHPKLEEIMTDFDRLEAYAHELKGNDLFLCLGTTMAKAGSRKAFIKVDLTYNLKIARMAAENKVHQILLVSSVGADPDALFFYSKVKGNLEQAIKQLPFWGIHIFQPSVLLGQREELRMGEKVAGSVGHWLDKVTGGGMTVYKPVHAETVALAMIRIAQKLNGGTHTYESHIIAEIAGVEEPN